MHTISYLYKLCPRCSALFAAWSVASFSLYLLHLSLSPALFILVWQMNLGQKLWKLKWVPPVEGDHCTNLNFRAMMKPKKEREKKATKKLPQNISHVSVACGQSWSHKRSAVTAKGEKEKGLPPIRNAHIQLVIWIAVLFPFPHRRAAYATRSTNNSLLPTSNSFNWTCCLALLPLSISLSVHPFFLYFRSSSSGPTRQQQKGH